MLNKDIYDWLLQAAEFSDFVTTTAQTDVAIKAQAGVELVLRFLAFRHIPYVSGLDLHEYLDKAMAEIAKKPPFELATEKQLFENTFSILNNALGPDAFKKWDGQTFRGKFLISVFEVLAHSTRLFS